MNDEPPVEFLDDWDSESTAPPARASRAWLLVVPVVVVAAAVVISMALGGRASTTSTPLPAYMTDRPAPGPGTPSVSLLGVGDFSATPYPDDVEQVPLTITVKDPAPQTVGDVLSFDVSVCVDPGSGSITGGRVPIFRDFWTLRSPSTNELLSPMASGGPTPLFPDQWYYLRGQCATGHVSFKPSKSFVPQYLQYVDQRLIWTWRLS